MSAADIFRDIKGDHRFYLCLSLINDLMWSLRYMIGLRTSMAVKAHKPHFHTAKCLEESSVRENSGTQEWVCVPQEPLHCRLVSRDLAGLEWDSWRGTQH